MSIKCTEEKILNKCPLCGEELEYISLYQYSVVYKILKNGTISKTIKYKRDEGPLDAAFLSCSKCDFHTDCDLDTDSTGNYKKIRIRQNNRNQFLVDIIKE